MIEISKERTPLLFYGTEVDTNTIHGKQKTEMKIIYKSQSQMVIDSFVSLCLKQAMTQRGVEIYAIFN